MQIAKPVEASPAARPLLSRRPAAASCAVFTSVEGALLDFDTLECSESRRVAHRLAAAGVPLIPVTGLTLAEMEPVAADLGIRRAMIVEAGGAIAESIAGAWTLEPLGPPADALLDAICHIEDISGAELVVYSVLEDEEATRLSGRSGAMLEASRRRYFSEPFLIEKGDFAEVFKAAAALGLSICRGPRFYYLVRGGNVATAFERLRHELRCDTTIAVGGSPIDADFLLRADVPIIVPRPDGRIDPQLRLMVPNAIVASAPGSTGWATVVSQVWGAVASAQVAIA